MGIHAELFLLLATAAAACALPGAFLVLRRLALVTDAISHVLLFGIVLTYLVVQDVASPWLFFGAAASGVLTVALVELVQKSQLIKADAAIGLVFPALFSIGVILLTMFVKKTIHLDVDQVLLGSPEFSVLEKWSAFGLPPVVSSTLVLTLLFVLTGLLLLLVYKELKLSTFDAAFATTLGFAPVWLHYGLMTLVSLTAVAAFNAVGPVTVVAFFVVPAASAYLLSDRLGWVIGLSLIIGIGGALLGTWLAGLLDTNIGGTVATTLGMLFGIVLLVAPHRGLIRQITQRWHQKRRFLETMLAIHLLQHEGTAQEADESRLDGLHRHLHWLPQAVSEVVRRAERHGLVQRDAECLLLTASGRDTANAAIRATTGTQR